MSGKLRPRWGLERRGRKRVSISLVAAQAPSGARRRSRRVTSGVTRGKTRRIDHGKTDHYPSRGAPVCRLWRNSRRPGRRSRISRGDARGLAQSQDVGDVEEHVLGLVRATGIASFQDGSTATTYFVAQVDYVKGSGTDTSYSNLTFDDGSVLWYKTAGAANVEGARTIFKGTITVIGGKGRFANAKGEGGYNGARLTPASADLFVDQMISVKK
jgi:hypothetical protein